MAPTKATNSAKQITNAITNVGVEVLQGCNTQISQSQNLNIIGNSGSVTTGNIDWSQVVSTNIACLQNSSTTTAIANAVTEAAQQTANVTNQEFNIPFGSNESNNIAEQITNVATQVNLAFTQNCIGIISQNQNVNVVNNSGVTVLGNLNWSQTADAVSQCIQTTSAVTNVTNNLAQSLEQTATTTIESFLGPFIAIIIVIVIIIGLIIYRGVGALTNWKFLLVVGGAIVLYFIVALIFKWPPFKSSSSSSSSTNNNAGTPGTFAPTTPAAGSTTPPTTPPNDANQNQNAAPAS